MIILGLDPGTATTGYGVIKVTGNQTIHVDHGCIITEANTPLAERLHIIATELRRLIAEHKPDRVSIEEIFFFKNATTVISVAQARGVLVAVATESGLPVHGYTPLQVKQALTSYGRADKQQMQKMIMLLLGLAETPRPDDAADALAIAITCANSVTLERVSD
jgi:crossover junction endodeoxyribonuclease RuvC